MKNIVRASAVVLGLIAGQNAWSVPIEVAGFRDTLMTGTNLGAMDDASETAWVASIMGAVDYMSKHDCNVSCAAQLVVGGGLDDVWSMVLTSAPEYFLISTRAGSSTGNTQFLYYNEPSTTYATFRMIEMGFGFGINSITEVNHLSWFKLATDTTPPTSSVPEPGTLALLGVGMFGVLLGRGRPRQQGLR
jgi:hypothetical protein